MSNDMNLLFYSSKCKTCGVFMQIAQKNNILKFFKLICIDGQEKNFQEKGLRKVPTIVIKNMGKPIDGNDCLIWLESTLKLRSGQVNDKTNEQYLPEVGITQGNSNIRNGMMGSQGQSAQPTQTTQTTQSNQFEVPKTNIMKRTSIGVTPPPTLTNVNVRSTNPLNPQNQMNQLNEQMKQLQEMHSKLLKTQSNPGGQSNSGPSVKPVHQLFGFMENEMSGCSDSYAYLLVDNPLPKSFLPPDKDLQIYTAPEGSKLDKKTQEMYLKNMELFRENEKTDLKRKIEEDHRNILTGK